MTRVPAPSQRRTTLAVRGDGARRGARVVPEEVPVAFVYDGGSEAVMMASPQDLEDLALGFSLNEGIIATPADVREIEVAAQPNGVELRLWLSPARSAALATRRRRRAGPTGCGLCGVESLQDALRDLPRVSLPLVVHPDEIVAAMSEMAARQTLNRETRAVHAAGFFLPGEGVLLVREDVGRHNALDKLAGALAREGYAAGAGVILMTSRISVELIQKAAAMGAPVLAAVSAPTSLALDTADQTGVTVLGVVRDDGLEVFTHPWRVAAAVDGKESSAHAA